MVRCWMVVGCLVGCNAVEEGPPFDAPHQGLWVVVEFEEGIDGCDEVPAELGFPFVQLGEGSGPVGDARESGLVAVPCTAEDDCQTGAAFVFLEWQGDEAFTDVTYGSFGAGVCSVQHLTETLVPDGTGLVLEYRREFGTQLANTPDQAGCDAMAASYTGAFECASSKRLVVEAP